MAGRPFPARASGPAERVAGFLAHLRLNALPCGPRETADALAALAAIDPADPHAARLALRAVLAHDAESWARFDALFDAYWQGGGRERPAAAPRARQRAAQPPALWRPHLGADAGEEAAEPQAEAADEPAPAADDARPGRLIGTRAESLARQDLRRLTDPALRAAAEEAALRLARALRDRRSRRRRAARRGSPDLRRTLRASLATGGEPLALRHRRRPDRPARLLVLLDVSGSMTAHARVFLAFLKGLVEADPTADAYLFHLRPIRVAGALRERDGLAAATRLSLLAEGFGGGTDIGASLEAFARAHGPRALSRRSVVLVVSDGYCTGSPEALATALARIAKRAGRIVWLDPVGTDAGARRHLAAARAHLDRLLPARTLADLAALEGEFARL